MVECHHKLDGHELEQAVGVGDGQESLVCSSPWGCKESDMTEQLNQTNIHYVYVYITYIHYTCIYIANKGSCSQSYGFSRSYVWM